MHKICSFQNTKLGGPTNPGRDILQLCHSRLLRCRRHLAIKGPLRKIYHAAPRRTAQGHWKPLCRQAASTAYISGLPPLQDSPGALAESRNAWTRCFENCEQAAFVPCPIQQRLDCISRPGWKRQALAPLRRAQKACKRFPYQTSHVSGARCHFRNFTPGNILDHKNNAQHCQDNIPTKTRGRRQRRQPLNPPHLVRGSRAC